MWLPILPRSLTTNTAAGLSRLALLKEKPAVAAGFSLSADRGVFFAGQVRSGQVRSGQTLESFNASATTVPATASNSGFQRPAACLPPRPYLPG